MRIWGRAVVVSLVLASIAGPAGFAHAQDAPPAIEWDAPCGDPTAFVSGVEELGGSFAGFEVAIAVAALDGAFHGTLRIGRAGEELAVRELDDPLCADVVDALVITAALTLRSLPPPPDREIVVDREPDPDLAAPIVPAPPAIAPRFALGASLRGGLGPTPGVAVAPSVIAALDYDRFFGAISVSFWPDSGAAIEGSARGVSLWALSSTLEAGYRIGDEFSFVPCLAIEPSVTIARGVGIERPREDAALVLDGGLAVWLALDLVDRVRLFARGDLLFGLVRPAYGVEGELAFAGPVVRGTGAAGVLVLF